MEILIRIILCGLMIFQVIVLIFIFIDMIKTSKNSEKLRKKIEEVNELQRKYYLEKLTEIKLTEIKKEPKKRGRKKKVEEK